MIFISADTKYLQAKEREEGEKKERRRREPFHIKE